MSFEDDRLMIPEYLAGQLDAAEQAAFEERLASTPELRVELEELRGIWQDLGSLPEAQPSPAMRAHFYQRLHALTKEPRESRKGLFGRWPARAGFQVGVSLAMVLAGIVIGGVLNIGRTSSPSEVSQLRQEVQSMRQLVALSLLNRQSASARLEGVAWGSRVERPDSQISSALISALNHDPNVNVRLATVEALQKLAADDAIRRALIDSISAQQSPLVQIALIDALVQVRGRDAGQEFGAVARNVQYDINVRKRAAWAVQQFQAQ
jgi:HEAT repeats